jgi:hypothetical protein
MDFEDKIVENEGVTDSEDAVDSVEETAETLDTEETSKKGKQKPGRKKTVKTAPEDSPDEDESGSEPPAKKSGGTTTLVLVGAGSFTSRLIKGVKKNQPFEADSEKAEKLIATGLFKAV